MLQQDAPNAQVIANYDKEWVFLLQF